MVENARYNGKASFEEWKKDWELEERYNFKTIESKWQKKWEEEKPYAAITGDPRPKFYGLIEFWWNFRTRPAQASMSGIPALTRPWTSLHAKSVWRD